MNLRPKAPERIREDALRVAARKMNAGCRSCADAYADVARRNGATDTEIRRIPRRGRAGNRCRRVKTGRSVGVLGNLFDGITSQGSSRTGARGRNRYPPYGPQEPWVTP